MLRTLCQGVVQRPLVERTAVALLAKFRLHLDVSDQDLLPRRIISAKQGNKTLVGLDTYTMLFLTRQNLDTRQAICGASTDLTRPANMTEIARARTACGSQLRYRHLTADREDA